MERILKFKLVNDFIGLFENFGTKLRSKMNSTRILIAIVHVEIRIFIEIFENFHSKLEKKKNTWTRIPMVVLRRIQILFGMRNTKSIIFHGILYSCSFFD